MTTPMFDARQAARIAFELDQAMSELLLDRDLMKRMNSAAHPYGALASVLSPV